MSYKKKLIKVALPFEVIKKAGLLRAIRDFFVQCRTKLDRAKKMNTNISDEKLKVLIDLSSSVLKEYHQKYYEYIKENRVPERTIASIIEEIFKYLAQTIEIIRILMKRENPYFKQSAILVRSMFEYSVRAAWASRVENGWMKYQAYWANEDKKWAQEAQNDEKLVVSASKKLKNIKEIIEKSGVEEDELGFLNMRQALKELWQKDIDDGNLGPDDQNYADFIYTNVYRPLSRYVHGNVFIFQTPDESLYRHIGGTIVQSVYFICYAFLHTIDIDTKNEINVLTGKIVPIVKESMNEPN